jgi:GT2 family glycosyltransferase
MLELGPYYQTANVFFPRDLLERLGGFDAASYPRPGGEDTDLAWRAFELGAEPVFAPDARVYHAVMELGALGVLRVAARWRHTMAVYVRHPRLRESVFIKRYFWKYTHYLLVRALPAALLPRRLGLLRGWFAFPYLRLLMMRARNEGVGLWVLPFYLVHDLVELQAVARAGLRLRRLML